MSAEAGWDIPPEAPENAGGRTPSPARRSGRSRSPEGRRMDIDDRRGDYPPPEEPRGRPPPGNNPGNNLHVSGLHARVEERDLEDLFSKYGRVQRAQVMRDPHTRDPRGFAFVTMEEAEDAEACIANLSATELMGKVITVDKARRGRARTPTPGTYHGPPKKSDFGPRGGGGYDRRPRRYDPYDDDRYYDRRPPPRSYRDDYRDRRGGYDTYAAPMRDDRRYDRYDRYDDRRREDDYYRRDRY